MRIQIMNMNKRIQVIQPIYAVEYKLCTLQIITPYLNWEAYILAVKAQPSLHNSESE